MILPAAASVAPQGAPTQHRRAAPQGGARRAGQRLREAIIALEDANRDHPEDGDMLEEAKYMRDTVIPAMAAVRAVADSSSASWPTTSGRCRSTRRCSSSSSRPHGAGSEGPAPAGPSPRAVAGFRPCHSRSIRPRRSSPPPTSTPAAAGLDVTVAVVDEGGLLKALGRMDGALPLSAQIAEAKAVGAAVRHRDGDQLASVQDQRGRLLRAGQPTHPAATHPRRRLGGDPRRRQGPWCGRRQRREAGGGPGMRRGRRGRDIRA